jgi:hypothetical protein
MAVMAAAAVARADSPAVAAAIFETNVLCIRASRVTGNFPEQLRAVQPASRTTGTILDLRFADGENGGAKAAVELFSAAKSPLVILVNGQTRGAAADLAVQLRAAKAGIVIGSTNAPGKISPDITVAVSADDEKKFQENPYASPVTNRTAPFSATNNLLAFVDHTSEAELVRKRIKDGGEDGGIVTPRAEPAQPVIREPTQPVIRDPALARAVDLLKARAVLHQSRG